MEKSYMISLKSHYLGAVVGNPVAAGISLATIGVQQQGKHSGSGWSMPAIMNTSKTW